MQYVWYTGKLACGCDFDWNEFQPVPKEGGVKRCKKHGTQVITEVVVHRPETEEEGELEYE